MAHNTTVDLIDDEEKAAIRTLEDHLLQMEEELNNKTAVALRQMCRDQGLPVSGKKQELITRLLNKSAGSSSKRKVEINGLIDKALKNCDAKMLRRNAYGNFEDPETHFVFNKDTKLVEGKQVGDQVVPLTPVEIQLCLENKWLP